MERTERAMATVSAALELGSAPANPTALPREGALPSSRCRSRAHRPRGRRREEGSRAAGGCAPEPRERGGRPEIPPPGPPRASPERREGGSLLGSGSAGRGGAGAAGSSCGGARPARRGEDGDADEARTEAR